MPDELDRLIAEAATLAGGQHPCRILGHKWAFYGCRNCGCEDGSCSFPVHRCESCGDWDYGDNDEAAEIKIACDERFTNAR